MHSLIHTSTHTISEKREMNIHQTPESTRKRKLPVKQTTASEAKLSSCPNEEATRHQLVSPVIKISKVKRVAPAQEEEAPTQATPQNALKTQRALRTSLRIKSSQGGDSSKKKGGIDGAMESQVLEKIQLQDTSRAGDVPLSTPSKNKHADNSGADSSKENASSKDQALKSETSYGQSAFLRKHPSVTTCGPRMDVLPS